MNTPTEDAIAVIGGGASAVVFLAHLSQLKNQRPREIRIFDRNHAFGRGVAYGTAHDFHLLNIRAENMSAFHNNPKHFAEWAAARGFDLRDFVPRPVYGEYLVEVLTQAIATLR